MQTIKLLTPLIVNGLQASPNDKNNGIYSVTDAEARNIIARKRAIKFEAKIEAKNNNSTVIDINILKKIAEELGVKFNNAIGAEKLQARVYDDLKAKAEEMNLTFTETLSLVEAYELYKSKLAEKDDNENNKVSVEELKKIAEAAEIEIPEDATDEDLQEIIETQLKEYANSLELEISADDNATILWAKIQNKLKETK